jgi:hypothetical protein
LCNCTLQYSADEAAVLILHERVCDAQRMAVRELRENPHMHKKRKFGAGTNVMEG